MAVRSPQGGDGGRARLKPNGRVEFIIGRTVVVVVVMIARG